MLAVRSIRSVLHRVVVLALLSLTCLVPLSAGSGASAATGDVGFAGPPTGAAGSSATGEKPESKLWFNDGKWWASMMSSGGAYHIWCLNRSASPETWVDTGTVLDNRSNTRADTLWDGSHLYVASAVVASSNTTFATGNPARLYRFSYSTSTGSYSLDSGYPASINNVSSETITLDKDTSGKLWATWTQSQSVYYNSTSGADNAWGTPAVLPVSNATGLTADDISTVVSFSNKIGVLWSNQATSTTYFSVHLNSAAAGTWQASIGVSIPGGGQSDDHLNIKDLQSDNSGNVYAVIKTGVDDVGGAPSSPLILGPKACQRRDLDARNLRYHCRLSHSARLGSRRRRRSGACVRDIAGRRLPFLWIPGQHLREDLVAGNSRVPYR